MYPVLPRGEYIYWIKFKVNLIENNLKYNDRIAEQRKKLDEKGSNYVNI